MKTSPARISTPRELAAVMLLAAFGMCLYLLLSGLPALLGGNFQAASMLASLRSWVLYCWVPWLLLAPLARVLSARLRSLAAFSSGNASKFVAALLALLSVHGIFVALILSLGATSATDILFALDQLFFGEGFVLFDTLLFTVLVSSNSFRSLQRALGEKDQQAYRLSRNLADSRLRSLKMQLNPHFLFNTLNGLAVLIDKQDNERARSMLGELSSFLRQTLRKPEEKWVTLEQELDFSRQYLRIEQYRFGTRLSCFEECEPLALSARIPPMLLQPLFENAIVHGLADKEGACRLVFECRLVDRYLHILIFDNGDSFDEARHPLRNAGTGYAGGIGLTNVQARLQEAYGGKFFFDIEKKPDGTLVTLKIPSYKDSQF